MTVCCSFSPLRFLKFILFTFHVPVAAVAAEGKIYVMGGDQVGDRFMASGSGEKAKVSLFPSPLLLFVDYV